jgi:membrane protease YdiL (CAAX protease family)
MGSDAIDNEAPSRTGNSGKPAQTAARKALDFLRTQAFYVVLVVLVVVMGGMRTWKELRAQEESERTGRPQESSGPSPLLQSALEKREQEYLAAALARPDKRCHRAATFAEAVEALTEYLFWAGCATALGIVLSSLRHRQTLTLPAAPEPTWGLWDVAKLAALWAAGAQLLHTRLFFRLNPERPFAGPGDWIAEIFVAILLVGAMIHIAVAERRGHLRDLGIRGNLFGGVAVGLAAFLVVQPFLRLVSFLEKRSFPEMPVQQVLQVIARTRSGSVLVLATIVAVVVAPVSEEMLFRGFLQPALGRWTGRRLAMLLSAAFFAAAHMDLYAMPMLLVLGIALAYIYDRTRSLAAPVTLHMAFNGITLLSVFAFRSLVSALSAPR